MDGTSAPAPVSAWRKSGEFEVESNASGEVKSGEITQLAGELTRWRVETFDGKKLGLRAKPDFNGPRTGVNLIVGEQFDVSEERRDFDGVLRLKLADGRGWAFDRKSGVGEMCVRSEMPPEGSHRLASGTLRTSGETTFPSL